MLGLCCGAGCPLVAARGGPSLCVRGVLTAVASVVSVHRLQGAWPSVVRHVGSEVVVLGLLSTRLIAVARGLSCSAAYGIFLNQRYNHVCLLHWQVGCLPPSHGGSPHTTVEP